MSAIKSILVHLDASPRCEVRLQTAVQIARRHGAELKALYSVVPQVLQVPSVAAANALLLEQINAVDDARRFATRTMFQRAIAGESLSVTWLDPVEELWLRTFARHALYADLVVLGQRETDDLSERGVPGDFVETVLLDSGKPVLVVPYIGVPARLGRTVMVAWKETCETARAVAAAMPMLRDAERVHIATWGKEQVLEGRRMADLVHYLGKHGVNATLHRNGAETDSIGEYILSSAADLGADMLLMGAYGHSRAREWVLGGATRTILESMTLPVLMSH
jgi:nucleotide-binding universal stress UspA family protein